MNINYPTKISWQLHLKNISNVNEIYSERTNNDIINSLNKFHLSSYYFKFEKVDSEYFEKFYPLYKANIESIHDGIVRDIKQSILENPDTSSKYEAISLYKNEIFLGGIVYFVRKNILYEVSKVFPKILEISLKVNVTFLAEYTLYNKALNEKIKKIYFGVDRNNYGAHGNIGLAIYKLRTGALPFVAKANEVEIKHEFNFNHESDLDTLVFLGAEKGEKISNALLFLNRKTTSTDKYIPLLKNKKLSVEIIQ